jgi:predicted nucleic acid-binding protein
MSSPAWLNLSRALADTGVFILWYRGEPNAKLFFRNPNIQIYFSRVTRKELLRSPIRDAERRLILNMLGTLRQINLDATIRDAYSELLNRYRSPTSSRRCSDCRYGMGEKLASRDDQSSPF